MVENKLSDYALVEPLQIAGHSVDHHDVQQYHDIDYDHLHDSKMNEWDEWLSDPNSRGGSLDERSSYSNGSSWEIDFGWQRNRFRASPVSEDTKKEDLMQAKLKFKSHLKSQSDLEEERAAKTNLRKILGEEEESQSDAVYPVSSHFSIAHDQEQEWTALQRLMFGMANNDTPQDDADDNIHDYFYDFGHRPEGAEWEDAAQGYKPYQHKEENLDEQKPVHEST